MSKTIRYDDKYRKTDHRRAGRPRRERRLSARAIQREEIDVARIARTVIRIAFDEAERDAQVRRSSDQQPGESSE